MPERIPGLAALASLKLSLPAAPKRNDGQIPGLAALASLKQGHHQLSPALTPDGFRGLLPWPH